MSNSLLTIIVSDLAKEVKPMVDEIEKSPETTQDHYGRYLTVISTLSGGNKNKAMLVSLSLMEAGANKSGIAWAMKFI